MRGPALVSRLMAWLALAVFAVACGDDQHAAPAAGDGGAIRDVVAADACATPATDCPCDSEGEVVDCGAVREKTNSYVLCERGSRACVAGTWSSCELSGETVTMS